MTYRALADPSGEWAILDASCRDAPSAQHSMRMRRLENDRYKVVRRILPWGRARRSRWWFLQRGARSA